MGNTLIRKIVLTVLWVSYIICQYFAGRSFIKNAPEGCEDMRMVFVWSFRMIIIFSSLILMGMIWMN